MFKCVICGRIFNEDEVIWVEQPKELAEPTCSVICAEKLRDKIIAQHQKIIDFMKEQDFTLQLKNK